MNRSSTGSGRSATVERNQGDEEVLAGRRDVDQLTDRSAVYSGGDPNAGQNAVEVALGYTSQLRRGAVDRCCYGRSTPALHPRTRRTRRTTGRAADGWIARREHRHCRRARHLARRQPRMRCSRPRPARWAASTRSTSPPARRRSSAASAGRRSVRDIAVRVPFASTAVRVVGFSGRRRRGRGRNALALRRLGHSRRPPLPSRPAARTTRRHADPRGLCGLRPLRLRRPARAAPARYLLQTVLLSGARSWSGTAVIA